MNRTAAAAIITAATCLATAATATAHTGTAQCATDGGYTITTDYRHLSPTLDVAASVIRWSDGYTYPVALPTNCTPATPPTPPIPEVVPPEVVPPFVPPVVLPPPDRPTVKKATKRTVTISVRPCTATRRSSVTRRTIVRWTTDGKVTRVKKSPTRRVYGATCRVPAVTG